MRRWLLLGSALLVASAGAGGNAWAAGSPAGAAPAAKVSARAATSHERIIRGRKQVIRLDRSTLKQQREMGPNVAQNFAALPVTAKINVTYIGFSAPARAAFQAAVNIWQTQIHSTVPIDVVADWSNLTAQYKDPSVLGAAGPTDFVTGFHEAPDQSVMYPMALADAIAGRDLKTPNVCNGWPASDFAYTSGADISASFNSAQTAWYYGTDGHPAAGQIDLESVVLHELGHGLGFVGTFDVPEFPAYGNGVFGVYGDDTDPSVFDSFVTDGLGNRLLDSYHNQPSQLGDALRGKDGGLLWTGTAGDAAAGGSPRLYAPNPYQEGSSFSHLDEGTYPAAGGNALMTPALHLGEVEHSVGPIVLGMLQDMYWPQTGSPAPTPVGDYHVAAPMRLVSQHAMTNFTPLTIPIAGVDGLPAYSDIKAVVVDVTVQSPTRTGIWQTLGNCSGPVYPSNQNLQAGRPRTMQTILPVEDDGTIQVSLTPTSTAVMLGVVSVDLVGWYGAGGVSYHPLASQQRAFAGTLTSTSIDMNLLGVAGVPSSGVTAVALSVGEGFGVTPGFVLVGPGGINSINPAVAYTYAELTQNLAIVPLGSGSAAGKIRLRLNTGHALVVVNVLGWYGPSTSGGLHFHSAGPMRLFGAPHGQDVTLGGFPSNTPLLLNIHVGSPSATATLSAAPGGSSALAAVQEVTAQQNTSGRTLVTTNAAGQVRLHLSSGSATFYIDLEGWFSGN